MKKLSSKSIINTIILSAGRGKRMRYKTKYKAKPLINIVDKTSKIKGTNHFYG